MPRVARTSERGFTLAGLLVILTVLAVVLAFSVPRMWSDILKRERDRQTIWVMKQYARAIAEFQRKNNGGLPVSLEQLSKYEPRVLRRLYPNPLSGEVDWLLVPVGGGGQHPSLTGSGAPRVGAPGTNPSGATTDPRSGVVTPGNPGNTQGPFIGVRPPESGQSYIALNGSDRYENWVYTITELQRELNPQLQPGAATTTPLPPTTRKP